MKVVVEPVSDLASRIVHDWSELAERAVEPNPFAEPAMVTNAAEHLPGGEAVGLLMVRSDRRLVMAVPVVRVSRFRRVPLPAVAIWSHAHSSSGVPLVEPDAVHEAWTAVLDWADRERIPWLVLDTVHDGGAALAPVDEVLIARGRRAHRFDPYSRPVVRRRPEATYTDGRMSSARRKKLRRHRRQLEEALGGELMARDLLEDAHDPDDAISRFLAMEASGWKGEDHTAMASTPGDAEFFRRLGHAMHSERRMQIWSLGTGDRAAAMACNLVAGNSIFHMKVCFDEQFARFSPGVQLEVDMLEAFHRDERLDLLDSCTGADNTGINQMYPDRQEMATLLIATHGARGRIAAASVPRAANAFRTTREFIYRTLRRTAPPDHGIT